MSRKSRLHDLIRVMRHHAGPVSGATLAETLGVSLRTLYQDIAVLRAVGVEIENAPGAGYVLEPGLMLPPLVLTEEQLDALALGLTRVKAEEVGPLAASAGEVLEQLSTALPEELGQALAGTGQDRANASPSPGPSPGPVAAEAATQPELIFYTNPLSRGGIVHWMLEELGVPYRMVPLEYGTTMKAPDYLAINPMGKVPAIRHGEVVVTEAAAICAYLADAFPAAGLAPAAGDRADYYRWLFFAAGPFETAGALNDQLGIAPSAEQQMRLGCGSYAAVLDTLAGAVEGRRFIAGEAFSAADVYVGAHLGWGMQFGTIPRRPEFEAYWAGLRDRPARLRCEAFVEQAMVQGV